MTPEKKIPQNRLIEMMHSAGVRPSLQRVATLDCICRLGHPTADEIYEALAPGLPTLSKTTVYNSLHALVEGALVRELDIESGTCHYDLAPQPRHSHFMCRRCGRIFDMPFPDNLAAGAAEGFAVDCVDIYFKGICRDCNNKLTSSN